MNVDMNLVLVILLISSCSWQACQCLPLAKMVAVPESPDVLIEAPKKELRENLKGEDGADESSIQFSTEGEEDSKQMQQRNDSSHNNGAGLIVDKPKEEQKNKFISRSESEKEAKLIEKDQLWASLTDAQKAKLAGRDEGHLSKDQAGPDMPEHHPEISLEEMRNIESPDPEKDEHKHMEDDHQGPRMPEHDVAKMERPRNKIQQVHNHAERKGAGPEFPDHDIETGPKVDLHNDTGDHAAEQNKTRSRRPDPNPEDLERLAKTIQLTKELALQKEREKEAEARSIEKMLHEKVEDSKTRDYLKLLMKQHIFPKKDQQKNGRIITDNPEELDKIKEDEEEIFKSIELEANEFLGLINMIIRDEKRHMSDEYFIIVEQKVMDNALKTIDFEAKQMGKGSARDGRKTLREWVRGFIRLHTPIVHDEN
ncbi:uncharacterized protein LOC134847721 isoform X2 [Symsagittifera roscoffensis]|uniref:uncharacterized protein LOC134847721 isoform X2 n=1 Tax=Symsagittifera roscoffensis TaxID=84072 RepID=UPI00307BE012